MQPLPAITISELGVLAGVFVLFFAGLKKEWAILKVFSGLFLIYFSFVQLLGTGFFWIGLGFSAFLMGWGIYDAF